MFLPLSARAPRTRGRGARADVVFGAAGDHPHFFGNRGRERSKEGVVLDDRSSRPFLE
jgi:hypothetical protein